MLNIFCNDPHGRTYGPGNDPIHTLGVDAGQLGGHINIFGLKSLGGTYCDPIFGGLDFHVSQSVFAESFIGVKKAYLFNTIFTHVLADFAHGIRCFIGRLKGPFRHRAWIALFQRSFQDNISAGMHESGNLLLFYESPHGHGCAGRCRPDDRHHIFRFQNFLERHDGFSGIAFRVPHYHLEFASVNTSLRIDFINSKQHGIPLSRSNVSGTAGQGENTCNLNGLSTKGKRRSDHQTDSQSRYNNHQ